MKNPRQSGTTIKRSLRVSCSGNGVLNSSRGGFNLLRRHWKWLGLPKKKIADKKIKQFDLIPNPSARDHLTDAEASVTLAPFGSLASFTL